ERKHIQAIVALRQGENGKKIDLPNNLIAIKEYEYIVLMKKQPRAPQQHWSFKVGKTRIENYGDILISKTISFKNKTSAQVLDAEKISKKAAWRFRQDGDIFEKFGGGTKTLNAYLIDKKVPARLRDTLPVLAVGNQILVIANLEISDKVKIDDTTIEAYLIEYVVD
ncbi:MAG: tRNA lysidine(34) synthetase TilS, partial [Firmicutes bacterium]|nr:tRNA lysidine(34) synthetase TilS [Bacillota bacterium]